MANKKIFEVIGAAALVGAIYKLGELKGSITTGVKMAKNPDTCEEARKVIDETKKGLEAVKEGKPFKVKITKDDFVCEVTDPEEGEENVSEDETKDQPED